MHAHRADRDKFTASSIGLARSMANCPAYVHAQPPVPLRPNKRLVFIPLRRFAAPPSTPTNERDAVAVTPDRTDDIQRDLQCGPKHRLSPMNAIAGNDPLSSGEIADISRLFRRQISTRVESQFAAGRNFTTPAGVGEAINGAARADPRKGFSNSRASTRENRNFTFTFGRDHRPFAATSGE